MTVEQMIIERTVPNFVPRDQRTSLYAFEIVGWGWFEQRYDLEPERLRRAQLDD